MRRNILITTIVVCLSILFLVLSTNRRDTEAQPAPRSSLEAHIELEKDSEAQTVLTEVMDAMQKVTPEDGALPRPGWKKEENFQKLTQIIEKYPGTESALTAKLLISHIYLDPDNPRRDLAKGKAIISEIQESFPETWQATIGEMTAGSFFFLQKEWEAAARSWEKTVDKIGDLEKSRNNKYVEYKKLLQNGRDYDLRGNMFEALMYSYCIRADFKKAEAMCKRLIKECPGHPQGDFARRALKKLQEGVSPYYTPPKKTKEEIAEEIRKVDEE